MSHASRRRSPARDVADTSDYAVIHHAIRSAGYALAAAAESLTRRRPAPHGRVHALLERATSARSSATTAIEDTIFFPALRERAPETAEVLDQLDAEHHLLDRLMEECRRGIEARRRRRRADGRRRRPAPPRRRDGRPPRPRGPRGRAAVRPSCSRPPSTRR